MLLQNFSICLLSGVFIQTSKINRTKASDSVPRVFDRREAALERAIDVCTAVVDWTRHVIEDRRIKRVGAVQQRIDKAKRFVAVAQTTFVDEREQTGERRTTGTGAGHDLCLVAAVSGVDAHHDVPFARQRH